jgi:drug/metabolite transporter (DMT)-like permease
MDFLNQHRTRLAPLFYMILAMVMWAIIENIPGFFTQHYTTFEIVWLRYSVHLVFMLVIFGPRVKLRLVRTKRLGLQLVRGLLMMGMHLSFIFAVKYIPVHTTMAGFWIAPLLLLGLSAWRGEKPDKLQWAITLLAFGAILVILRPLDGIQHPATLLSLGMAVCFVLYMQMTRAMTGEDLLASLFYTAFSVWIVLSFLMPFYWVTPNVWDMLLFVAIGLLGFLCIYGFDKAAEIAPTWVSAPFAMIQPLLIIGIDLGFRGINPGRLSLAAALLILACFGYLAWRNSPLRTNPGYHHV